jgi:hypothetical protein
MHYIHIFILLIVMILALLAYACYTRPITEGFAGATDGSLPLDASNPTLEPEQYYGDIPQSASISLFRSNELTVATANPDAIPNSEGDAKTGAGAGPYLNLTSFPDQVPPDDDIEVILNKKALTEGFQVADVAKQVAMNAAQGQVDSLKAQLTPEALKQRAIDEAKARAQARLEEEAKKKAKKGSKMLLKGATKTAQKLKGKLLSKVGSKIGKKATSGFLKKIIQKAATKIITKAGIAATIGGGLSSNPITLGFGIFMNVVAAIGLVLGSVLPLEYEDEGVCDPGWTRVSDNWPSYLDQIPGLGDIMGALAPYMCSLNGCDADKPDEDGGLCYPRCDGGYKGVGPVCWTENVNIGVGVLRTCPPGWQDDGALICKEPSGQICGDDCSKGWDSCRRRGAFGECWGGCREGCSTVYLGAWVGKFNNDSRLKCPSSHPELIDGLCYRPCPMMGGEVTTITKTYPVYVKKLPSPNRDAAEKALADAILDKTTKPETIKDLQDKLGLAMTLDAGLLPDPKAIYIRNPSGPRLGAEPKDAAGDPLIPRAPRRWPAAEAPKYNDLLAAVENGKVVFYSKSLGGWLTFESIFGSYGKQLAKDGRKAVKVTMSEAGPQILTDVDGRCYRWSTDKADWEWNNWGNFKDLAAANHSFTYFIGTNDKLYHYRWKGNARGLGESGGESAGGWYAMVGIAANDFAKGYANKDNDHGNAFTTNSAGWEAIIRDWDKRYLWGNDRTYDNTKFGKATCVAMTPNDTLTKFIATDKGYIYTSTGYDLPGSIKEVGGTSAKKILEGPVVGTAITSMTVDQTNTLYVICGGKLYLQVPEAGPEPQRMIDDIVWDSCATKFPPPFNFCIGGMKSTGKKIPNPQYDTQISDWKARVAASSNAIKGWAEIVGKSVTSIAIGYPMTNEQYTAYMKYKEYNDILVRDVYSKYPFPNPSVSESKIPILTQTIVTDPRKKLRHIPLMPFQCMGDRGIAYGRGVGVPKLKTKMAGKTPPPPPPPSAWLSSAHAEDPATSRVADFSSNAMLQDMCLFYYNKSLLFTTTDKDGSVTYSYITKVTSVIASSEQSADIICEITNSIVNPTTGDLISKNTVTGADRRFYFAIIKKTGKFVVTACTNLNGKAPYAKDPQAKSVNFTPVLDKCVNQMLTYDKCSDPKMIDAMIKLYTDNPLNNIRTKSVTAIELSGTDSCSLVWNAVMFDPVTQIEAKPDKKAAKFLFVQNKTTDACAYNLKSFTSIDGSMIKPLDKPILYASPPPIVSAEEEEEEEVVEEVEEEAEEEVVEEEADTQEGFLNVVFKRDYMY